MRIARFEPWPYVDLLHRELAQRTDKNTAVDWSPAVDIAEEKDRILLQADVPGISPDDVEISLEDGILTISGNRPAPTWSEDSDVRRSERRSGRFSRQFTLPETVDAERVSAKINNGILEVSIPKLPVVEPRRITVEAA